METQHWKPKNRRGMQEQQHLEHCDPAMDSPSYVVSSSCRRAGAFVARSVVAFLLLSAIPCCWAQVEEMAEAEVVIDPKSEPSYRSDYGRVAQVLQKCPVPSSWSQQHDEDGPDPKWVIQNELSFRNGDWFQAPDVQRPLLFPFTDSTNSSLEAFRLASFWITDVNLRSRKGTVKISAVLQLAVSKQRSIGYYSAAAETFESSEEGFSALTILMEGVYFENRQERGVCMVGCTQLPRSISNAGAVQRSCDLYLELHYPLKLSLLSREVSGFLRSWSSSKKADSKLFDDVQIASQLGSFTKYEFDDGALLKPAFNPSLQQMPPRGILVYRRNRFCSTMMEIASSQWIQLSNPGPFSPNSTAMRILDIRCIDFSGTTEDLANVSVVFRAISSAQDANLASDRSALQDGFAFAAEGMYNSSTGELCMLGCRKKFSADQQHSCDVRVSIFVPLSFSISQRSVLVGGFTPLGSAGFQAASFWMFTPLRSLSREVSKTILYHYSQIKEAKRLADQDEAETSLSDRLKLSVLKFPAPRKEYSIQQVGQDLMVQSELLPESRPNQKNTEEALPSKILDLQVLSVEDVMLVDWYGFSETADFGVEPSPKRAREETKMLRVAVEIVVSAEARLPRLSAEGVYVPRTGKMHLAGCKRQASGPKADQNLFDYFASHGDCNVTIVVQYPPRNTLWLENPTVQIQISSTHVKSDPAFFEDIKFQTFPILYKGQLHEMLSRKTLEAVLSSLTLSAMVICIALQLMHVKKSTESIPFISLVMLSVQAFGYSIPLITGAEALFARLTSSYDAAAEAERSSVIKDRPLNQLVLYLVKLLSLGAFLLMLRLCQKVVRSRIRLRTKFPLEPRRVPSEIKTLKIFGLVHLLGFCIVLTFHYILRSTMEIESYVNWDGRLHRREKEWITELKEYVGLVEDLFLLPQVIAASIWEIKGKPLRPAYYIGITILRLLPHVYSLFSKPLFNPFFAEESSVFANPGMDFYTRAGDLLIPLLAVGLAGAVYAQQRWNGLRWGKVIRQGSNKLMRYGSKLYERLPSKGIERIPSSKTNFEAEMMPSFPEGASLIEVEDGSKR